MEYEFQNPYSILHYQWSMEYDFQTHTPYSILKNPDLWPEVKEYLGRCSSISIGPFSAAGKENIHTFGGGSALRYHPRATVVASNNVLFDTTTVALRWYLDTYPPPQVCIYYYTNTSTRRNHRVDSGSLGKEGSHFNIC